MAAKLKIEKGGDEIKEKCSPLKLLSLCEFPIGSYVKLSSAVAVTLVGVLKCNIGPYGKFT
jgi:hypothetical protein